MKNLYLFVGPSGSGKSTAICKLHEMYGWPMIESYTNRPMRCPNEVGHIFVSKEEFEALPQKLALVYYHGYGYCVIPEQITDGGLYAIEPSGVEFFRNSPYSSKIKVVGFPLNEDLYVKRMRDRGDTEESIEARVNGERELFKHVAGISDIYLGGVVSDLAKYITKEEA